MFFIWTAIISVGGVALIGGGMTLISNHFDKVRMEREAAEEASWRVESAEAKRRAAVICATGGGIIDTDRYC